MASKWIVALIAIALAAAWPCRARGQTLPQAPDASAQADAVAPPSTDDDKGDDDDAVTGLDADAALAEIADDAGSVIIVEGRAPQPDTDVERTQLSRRELTVLPGTRGDPVAALTALPSVSTASVNSASLGGGAIIRGTSPEDSAFLIDGLEIPVINHFGDVQSVIPAALIEEIEFLPGGFGVEYGQATGGVVNVRSRPSRSAELTGSAEVSFINAAGFIEGPLNRAKTLRLTAGFRRSFIDAVLPALVPDDAELAFSTAPYYYDGQLRLDYEASSKHSFSWLTIGSFDRMAFDTGAENPADPVLTGEFSQRVGFWRSILGWDALDGNVENRARVSVGTVVYEQAINDDFAIDYRSLDLQARDDFGWTATPWLRVRAGFDGILRLGDVRVVTPLPPGEGNPDDGSFSEDPIADVDAVHRDHRLSGYAAVDIDVTRSVRITPGVRSDYFRRYRAHRLSPRVNASYRATPRLELRAGGGLYARGLGVSAESLATDLEPERAIHGTAGAEYQVTDGVAATVTGFYSALDDLVVRGADVPEDDPLAAYENLGSGRAYGGELLVRARSEHFFGWISYSLSRSERRDAPNMPMRLFDGDQTHRAVAVASAQLGAWTIGGRFSLASGVPTTPVMGSVFQADVGTWRPMYGAVNSRRLATAHQLDLRVDRQWQFDDWSLTAFVDVTNVYANPAILDDDYNYDYSEREPVEGVPFLPSLGLKGVF